MTEEILTEELREKINVYIRDLSEQERIFLNLYYYKGYSKIVISKILEMSIEDLIKMEQKILSDIKVLIDLEEQKNNNENGEIKK